MTEITGRNATDKNRGYGLYDPYNPYKQGGYTEKVLRDHMMFRVETAEDNPFKNFNSSSFN